MCFKWEKLENMNSPLIYMYRIWKSFVFLKMGRKKEVSAGYQHKCIIIMIFREFNFLHNYYNYEGTSLVEYKVVINDIYY